VKVVGLYLVRNEVDLIEVNLRHHFATAIDEAIVIDNGSSDGTLEKVALLAETMPIQLASEPGPYDQSARVTRMARVAFRDGADWILPIDADEFWIGTDTALRSVLQDFPADVSAVRAEIVNFIQRRDVLTAGPTNLLSMTMRPERQVGPIELCEELVESQQIGFVEMMYPPKWVSRAYPDMVITNGNHSVEAIPDSAVTTERILCLHAPLRARSLLAGKLDQGRRVIEDEGRKDYWHVRRWWRLCREGKIDNEWGANSYENGSLTVGGQTRDLVEDTRLRQAIVDLVPSSSPAGNDTPDVVHPAVAAYLLALDTVPGTFSSLDFRIFAEIDRAQREHGIHGDVLEMGSSSAKAAILLGHLARISQAEFVISDDVEADDFSGQYLRFHDRLPRIFEGGSPGVDVETTGERYRFIHVECGRPPEVVRRDIGTAERLLVPGGVVILEGLTDSSSGSTFSLQEEVMDDHFVPILLTDTKVYGVRELRRIDWASWMGDWVGRNTDLTSEPHTLAGRQVWRLTASSPNVVSAGLTTIPALESVVVDASPTPDTSDRPSGGGRNPEVGAAGEREANRDRYDSAFYDFTGDAARSSAIEIVPLVLEMTSARSVVDVGCGIGTWLSVFLHLGIDDVLGLDGGHVDVSTLEIPRSAFRVWNIEQPLPDNRRFDLALCLEVAEHISAGRADALVDDLVRLAPIICFSAATPLQGGVGHVNEQWPTYWIRKFAERGLSVVDAVRPAVWDNENVAMWYAQNCFLFATSDALSGRQSLAEAYKSTRTHQVDLVHPSLFLYHRLGMDRPMARVPLDAAEGWTEQPRSPDVRLSPESHPLPHGSEGAVPAPPPGLRMLLRELPGAARRSFVARWRGSRSAE
jgi:SAM-dependent methyltransferase